MFTFWKNFCRCNISKFQFFCVSPSVSSVSNVFYLSFFTQRGALPLPPDFTLHCGIVPLVSKWILPAVIHHLIANRIIVIVYLLIHLILLIILLLIILITFLVATSIIRCPSANDLSRSWLVHASQPEALPKANQVFQHLARHCQQYCDWFLELVDY